MKPRYRILPSLLVLLLVALIPGSAQAAPENVDLEIIHRIKAEAFKNSQVMEHMFYMADVHGPRLSHSPGYQAAANWVVATLREWGAENIDQETWGEFGVGWSLQRFSAHMVEPAYAPLPGIPKAWTGGTGGRVIAEVVAAPLYETDVERAEDWDLEKRVARYEAYAERYAGQLGGKIVLMDTPREMSLPMRPDGRRHDRESLSELAGAPEPFIAPEYELPLTKVPADRAERRKLFASLPLPVAATYFQERAKTLDVLNAFLRDEGVIAVLQTDRRGTGSIAFAEAGANYKPDAPVPPPMVALAPEPYARISRLVEKEIPVQVELDVRVAFHDETLEDFNVIGEIPGDGKADEVIMLGGHLDSWHGATGATDNAAGCAVALEAFRILKTLGLEMDRTVRLALWGGEEQGIWGSRGYVERHFADPATMELKPEHEKLSGYFNLDNGTGKIRGVYLQGNDMMRPIFEAWLGPFKDMDVTTISIRNTGGTDHLSFNAVGLPGFQFIQDPMDYSSRTHHSDLDSVDHVNPPDLMQASAVMASVVYHAATREEMLPRKPLPEPVEMESMETGD